MQFQNLVSQVMHQARGCPATQFLGDFKKNNKNNKNPNTFALNKKKSFLRRLAPKVARQLMVVAHADDEILFGGSLLSEGPPWLVVVATAPVAPADQKQREEELVAALGHFSS
ncbi:unnamed protein product, partial [Polarella glacialis]